MMSSSSSSSDEDFRLNKDSNSSSKKRQSHGRMRDVNKKLRCATHETGNDCVCKHLKCFENVTEMDHKYLIKSFNSLKDRDAQSSYLSGLITVQDVKRRRPVKPDDLAQYNSHSYLYKVRVLRDGKALEISVCYKAFLAIFGITPRRVQTLKKSLSDTGTPHVDNRGKHNNRPRRLSDDTLTAVTDWLGSLKGRKSHYSLKESSKVYLPEHLNIKALHTMYSDKYPNRNISYEKFREIFENKFNIGFGYPRMDTCSTCDEYRKCEEGLLAKKKSNISPEALKEIDPQLGTIKVQHELHLRKAFAFYKAKRTAKRKAQKNKEYEAITMDFCKNLPLPNITTQDVYYKRQLSFYMFNITVLLNGSSFFYTYDQTVAKKGADDVVSILNHFIEVFLDPAVRRLSIFCDSCAGQNKNYTVLRYLHFITSGKKRFEEVTVTFPIRGHSYMESDKQMALINQKSETEVPDDWRDVVANSRLKPSPFVVFDCKQDMFKKWTDFLAPLYLRKCKIPTRPIVEIKFLKEKSSVIGHRESYNARFLFDVVKIVRGKERVAESKAALIKALKGDPSMLYGGKLAVNKEKYDDLQHLKKFCGPRGKEFFSNLKVGDVNEDLDLDGDF